MIEKSTKGKSTQDEKQNTIKRQAEIKPEHVKGDIQMGMQTNGDRVHQIRERTERGKNIQLREQIS